MAIWSLSRVNCAKYILLTLYTVGFSQSQGELRSLTSTNWARLKRTSSSPVETASNLGPFPNALEVKCMQSIKSTIHIASRCNLAGNLLIGN